MDIEKAARGFTAVGSPSRLEVLICLVRAGPSGLPVGQIQQRTGLPASTLAHHLRFLRQGELIEQVQDGRNVVTHAAYEHIQALGNFLMRECCADSTDHINPGCS